MIWALLYLAAIVGANVTISHFGPIAAPVVAFLMIGALLTLRDALHDRYGPWVVVILIPTGALLSVLFGPDVAVIALAGAVAFAVSELVDTGVYHRLLHWPWQRRVNASNVFGAATDSLIFPILAFGGFPWVIILLQFIAKVAGGAMWAWMISLVRKPKRVEGLCYCGTGASMHVEDQYASNWRWICDECGGHVCYDNELDPAWPYT